MTRALQAALEERHWLRKELGEVEARLPSVDRGVGEESEAVVEKEAKEEIVEEQVKKEVEAFKTKETLVVDSAQGGKPVPKVLDGRSPLLEKLVSRVRDFFALR